MKNLKKVWHRIPRKARVLIQIILLLLTAVVFYISIGSPAFGPEHRFRRAEKAQCIGPSTILATVKLDGINYDHVLLAEDELGTYMYLYEDDHDYGALHYRKKTGDFTVVPVPQYANEFNAKQINLPIIAFDDCPEAVRATLEVTVSASSTITYSAEAQRENDGYFCFWIRQTGWGNQIDMLCALSGISSRYAGNSLLSFPVTVRLYDENNRLIRAEHLTLRSPAGEANAAEKEALS